MGRVTEGTQDGHERDGADSRASAADARAPRDDRRRGRSGRTASAGARSASTGKAPGTPTSSERESPKERKVRGSSRNAAPSAKQAEDGGPDSTAGPTKSRSTGGAGGAGKKAGGAARGGRAGGRRAAADETPAGVGGAEPAEPADGSGHSGGTDEPTPGDPAEDSGTGSPPPGDAGAGRSTARKDRTEPLRASWRPTSGDAGGRRSGGRSGLRRFTATYGWRVFLVPVLVVVTALVVVDTTSGGGALVGEPSAAEGTNAGGADGAAGAEDEPVVEENPAEPIDLDIPTAELPDGGEYTEEGEGTWQVVPLKEGDGDRVGDAEPLYTYTVEVEDGLDPASFAGVDSFAAAVEGTLSDPRSWTGTGEISLQRVGEDAPDPDFRVSLTSPATTKQAGMCGSAIPYEASCRLGPPIDRVVINLARYVRGALAFNADLTGYRQYVINHEVGHALDNDHVGCAADGALAPVMMQQTFGVANDYVAKLNDRVGGDPDSVPADGKTCEPNAWPNPQAKPD